MKSNKYLLAAACVLLASKFYEIDDNLIMINDIQKEFKEQIKLMYEEVTRTEIYVLGHLEWNLFRTMPIDYVQTMV